MFKPERSASAILVGNGVLYQVASLTSFFNQLNINILYRLAAEISLPGTIVGLKHWGMAQVVAFQLESEETTLAF